jgi:MerR family mercuric resistance operon transcriptional regulator
VEDIFSDLAYPHLGQVKIEYISRLFINGRLLQGFSGSIKPVVATGSRDVFMSPSNKITVGILASETGCNVETVRYYEKIGLMPDPPRSQGGHRLYAREHIRRLMFIRRCRHLGFGVPQVRGMLKLIDEPGHVCGEVKAMTLRHAKEIKQKIRELKRLEKALNSMTEQCVEDDAAEQCPIIDALYRPEQ